MMATSFGPSSKNVLVLSIPVGETKGCVLVVPSSFRAGDGVVGYQSYVLAADQGWEGPCKVVQPECVDDVEASETYNLKG